MSNRARLAAFMVTALAAGGLLAYGILFREEIGEVLFNAAML